MEDQNTVSRLASNQRTNFSAWLKPVPAEYPNYDHEIGHTKIRRRLDLYTLFDAFFVVLATAMSIAVAWIFLREGITTNPWRLLNLVIFWFVFTYVALPRLHQVFTKIYVPDYFIGRTRTADGLLGDPVNLAFEGSEEDIHLSFRNAGWQMAEENTLHSARKMVTATLAFKSYPEAPVSALYLFGRQHEFAYQQEVGGNTIKRHHIRFWRVPRGWIMPGGHKVSWLAAATYDRSVGLSRYTWQVTHKIDENTDIERDYVVDTLLFADQELKVGVIKDFFTSYHHVNGGGDPLKTDGHLPVVDTSLALERAVARNQSDLVEEAKSAALQTASINSRATYLKGRTLRSNDLFETIAQNWHDAVDDVMELFKHPGDRHLPPPSVLFAGSMLLLQTLATLYLWAVNVWWPNLLTDRSTRSITRIIWPSEYSISNEALYAISIIMVALIIVYLMLLFRNRWARLILMTLLSVDSLLRLMNAFDLELAGQLAVGELLGIGLSSLALLSLTSDATRLWVMTARASQVKKLD